MNAMLEPLPPGATATRSSPAADQRGYRLPARRLAGSADEFVTELQIPVAEEDVR